MKYALCLLVFLAGYASAHELVVLRDGGTLSGDTTLSSVGAAVRSDTGLVLVDRSQVAAIEFSGPAPVLRGSAAGVPIANAINPRVALVEVVIGGEQFGIQIPGRIDPDGYRIPLPAAVEGRILPPIPGEEGEIRGAAFLVLAYDDLNHNGYFDLFFDEDGVLEDVSDQVLGSTPVPGGSQDLPAGALLMFLLYLERPVHFTEDGTVVDLPGGFSLLGIDPADDDVPLVFPLDAPLPLFPISPLEDIDNGFAPESIGQGLPEGVLLTDGRAFVGQVTLSADGVGVRTARGFRQFPRDQVARISLGTADIAGPSLHGSAGGVDLSGAAQPRVVALALSDGDPVAQLPGSLDGAGYVVPLPPGLPGGPYQTLGPDGPPGVLLLVIVYDDVNDNHVADEGEPLLAASSDGLDPPLAVFLPRAGSATDPSGAQVDLPAGYSIVLGQPGSLEVVSIDTALDLITARPGAQVSD